MASVIYNIPASLREAYRGHQRIIRCHNPRELLEGFLEQDLKDLTGIQLLLPTDAVDELRDWGYAIPVDLVLLDPQRDFPSLYQHSELLASHPVRVSVPVVPGFSKAVKLAVSLNFAVKLEVTQPDPILIGEMATVLDFYLRHSNVAQPIDYFHSLLLAFYQNECVTLWDIQEEDPALFRYVTDQGEETLSARFAALASSGDIDSLVQGLKRGLLAEGSECHSCEFLAHCGGYFKWPRREYRCDGVKTLFRTLRDAAGELHADLANLPAAAEDSAL
jgi:hypothetical protein